MASRIFSYKAVAASRCFGEGAQNEGPRSRSLKGPRPGGNALAGAETSNKRRGKPDHPPNHSKPTLEVLWNLIRNEKGRDPVGPRPGRYLLAALAAAARHGLDDLDLFAVHFDQVADVDHALVAGAGPLLLAMHVVLRYAVGVHSFHPFLWAVPPGD